MLCLAVVREWCRQDDLNTADLVESVSSALVEVADT